MGLSHLHSNGAGPAVRGGRAATRGCCFSCSEGRGPCSQSDVPGTLESPGTHSSPAGSSPPSTSQIPATWGPRGAQVGHDLLRNHTAPSVASAVPAPPSRVAQAFSTRKSPWLRQPDLRALRIQMSSSRSEHVEGRKPWASPNINQ